MHANINYTALIDILNEICSLAVLRKIINDTIDKFVPKNLLAEITAQFTLVMNIVVFSGSSCMTVGGFPLHKFAWPLFYGLLSRSSGPRNFD